MILSSTKTFNSATFPEVSFTVRVLNRIERARRDALIAGPRAEFSRLERERSALLRSLIPNADWETAAGQAEASERIQKLPLADKERVFALKEDAQIVHDAQIVPAEIRAALIGVTGLECDGAAATVESVIASAPDELLIEIHAACVSASGLTAEQEKNSQLPGSFARQEDGTIESSIAPNAG